MRPVIENDKTKCVGCNKCLRVCPVEEANISFTENRRPKVRVDNGKCIACGACVAACRHGSRGFEDDTELFFADLARGENISLIAAPAARTNFSNFGRLLSFLRYKGVKKIYDVSLGADICTWAHIRYIQKNNPGPIITQPCPAIVNYIVLHRHELVKSLSPIHSPMLCTAVYMRRHEGVAGKIAALSPCIAKTHEFESTRFVDYNVTFYALAKYLENNHISLPINETGFDHYQSALGGVYSQPGGLKENIEFFLGKALRIDKSEGQHAVYKAIDEFAGTPKNELPAVFDVLNCAEGCNDGTGCVHGKNLFSINTAMDKVRKAALANRDKEYFDNLYKTYDSILNLSDYTRSYTPINIRPINYTQNDLERAYLAMNKHTEENRRIDCAACGHESCRVMATRIAKKIDLPENCIHASHIILSEQRDKLLGFCKNNNANTRDLRDKMKDITRLTDDMKVDMANIQASVGEYEKMAAELGVVSTQIYMISVNASVEAARAGGVYGKAFAVVAEEIQKLAKFTKESLERAGKHSNESKAASAAIKKVFGTMERDITAASADIANIYEATQTLLDG